jgi:hypothetical protein
MSQSPIPQHPSLANRPGAPESTGEFTSSNAGTPIMRRAGRIPSDERLQVTNGAVSDQVQRRSSTGNAGDTPRWHETLGFVHDSPPLRRAG